MLGIGKGWKRQISLLLCALVWVQCCIGASGLEIEMPAEIMETPYREAAAYSSVMYLPNGATGGDVPADDQYYESGAAVTILPSGSLSREGSKFKGWNTAADGSGIAYMPGDTFFIDGDMILYAQWGVSTQIHHAYMAGYGNGDFRPEDEITRAEVAQILYNLYMNQDKLPVLPDGPGTQVFFTDVPGEEWYYEAVMFLARHGIINGYRDGSFRPNNSIARSEVAAMTVLAADCALSTTASPLFHDIPKDYWALKYINTCKEQGFMNGYEGGGFRPEDFIARGEVTATINQALGRMPNIVRDNGVFKDVRRDHWAVKHILEAGITHGCYLGADGYEVWLPVRRVQYLAGEGTVGTVPKDETLYLADDPVTVLDPGDLRRPGYLFDGWTGVLEGRSFRYDPGDSFLMADEDVILSPRWLSEMEYQHEILEVVNPPRQQVPCETWAYLLELPDEVRVILRNQRADTLKVSWDTAGYDGGTPGEYVLEGVLELPADRYVYNPEGLTATLRIQVEDELSPSPMPSPEPSLAPSPAPTQTPAPTLSPLPSITPSPEPKPDRYTVYFDSDGGSPVAAVTVDGGTYLTAPEDPVREGYLFEGWYLEELLFQFTLIPITRDFHLKARWKPEQAEYTVIFDSAGGTPTPPVMVKGGELLKKPTDPLREGYAFEGWYLGENLYAFEKPVSGDLMLYARWRVRALEVSFVIQGGDLFDSKSVPYGEKVPKPMDPVRPGYEFLGWQLDGKDYDFDSPVTGDLRIYALWDTEKFSVRYHSNGASGTAPEDLKQYSSGDQVIVNFEHDMTLHEYQFLGWGTSFTDRVPVYRQGETTSFTITGDTDLYAVWFIAVAEIDGVAYDSVEKALCQAKEGETVRLLRSGWIAQDITTAPKVRLQLSDNVTLTVEANGKLEIDRILYSSGARIVNHGAIFGKMEGRFLTEAQRGFFGSYEGSGVVFTTRERYRNLPVTLTGNQTGFSGESREGVLTVRGAAGLAVGTYANGISYTDHYVSVQYQLPSGVHALDVQYGTFQKEVQVDWNYGQNQTLVAHYDSTMLPGGIFTLPIRAQYLAKPDYQMVCGNLLSLPDGFTAAELFRLDFSGLSVNRQIPAPALSAVGELYLRGGSYRIPGSTTLTVERGTIVGMDQLDHDGTGVDVLLEGVNETSLLTFRDGTEIRFLNGSRNNFCHSDGSPYAGGGTGISFSQDTSFWWDKASGNWVGP